MIFNNSNVSEVQDVVNKTKFFCNCFKKKKKLVANKNQYQEGWRRAMYMKIHEVF